MGGNRWPIIWLFISIFTVLINHFCIFDTTLRAMNIWYNQCLWHLHKFLFFSHPVSSRVPRSINWSNWKHKETRLWVDTSWTRIEVLLLFGGNGNREEEVRMIALSQGFSTFVICVLCTLIIFCVPLKVFPICVPYCSN